MRILAAALAIAVLCSTAAPAALPTNHPPLADAGLDQTVRKHATVHLDATGSRDPDGSITSYHWTIHTPSGNTTTPACATCARTSFTPATVGTYRVTLTITDDDGATATDTLYVTVTPGAPPQVSISGPTATTAGTPVTYDAAATAGGAPLRTITWTIDGTTVESIGVSGDHATVHLYHTYGTPGTHTITATVTDTDGRTATDSLTITVDPDTPPGDGPTRNRTSRDPPSTPPSGSRTYADRDSPVVRGPSLVTGSRPLDATYRLHSDTGHVRTINWWRDNRNVAPGKTLPVTWLPGRHTLYATVTYTDGSRTVARFPDGSTTVQADPKPTVSLDDPHKRGRIQATATATDSFGNLQQLTVSIDGERVAATSINPIELRNSDAGSTLRLPFEYSDIQPQRPHRITIRAEDARGQVTSYTTTVTPTGTPEIVSSEFVNGPVDSYHPKLDPERYAAHHVLKVDLNGIEPEEVSISLLQMDQAMEVITGYAEFNRKRRYNSRSDVLTVHSYWSGEFPGVYGIKAEIIVRSAIRNSSRPDLFTVTPSKPEVRVDVISGGTPFDKNDWGIIVDASESFDPDGTDLTYIWGGGVEAITEDNSTAKFESMNIGTLKVRDGDGQVTVFRSKFSLSNLFLFYFTPEVTTVTEVSSGPYKPKESVVFQLKTKSFRMPKNHYYNDFGLKLQPVAGGRVLQWKAHSLMNTTDLSERENRYYTGTVKIPASTLVNSSESALSMYNTRAPERSLTSVKLPSVRVLQKGSKTIGNVSVDNVSYLERQPITKQVTTTYRSMVEDYRSQGYVVVGSTLAGTRYTLEKRVKVQDAKYRIDTRRFDSRARRNTFLALYSDWRRGETETETKRWTSTEREWRDSRSGRGTFTGRTRKILISPAEYRTKRQYRYEYRVRQTGTRTVTRTRSVRVPVTRYRWVTRCSYLGCIRKRLSYTTWTTYSQTYTVTKTYQYYVTKTDTYWSFYKRSPADDYTGRSRRVQVEPPEYETQYQYEYRVNHSEPIRYYTATRRVVVQPAEYEWREYTTTKSELVAQAARVALKRRVGSEEPARVWTLQKQTGSELRWTTDARDRDSVSRTRATISYKVYQKWEGEGNTVVEKQNVTEQIILTGYYSPSELITGFGEQEKGKNQDRIV